MAIQKRKIDNPLLQSTLKRPTASTAAKAPRAKADAKSNLALIKSATSKQKYFMSPEEEKVSVFEIISDLEKQLEDIDIIQPPETSGRKGF